MSRRQQTAKILNPTHSNRQDLQHMATADIRYEMCLFKTILKLSIKTILHSYNVRS